MLSNGLPLVFVSDVFVDDAELVAELTWSLAVLDEGTGGIDDEMKEAEGAELRPVAMGMSVDAPITELVLEGAAVVGAGAVVSVKTETEVTVVVADGAPSAVRAAPLQSTGEPSSRRESRLVGSMAAADSTDCREERKSRKMQARSVERRDPKQKAERLGWTRLATKMGERDRKRAAAD